MTHLLPSGNTLVHPLPAPPDRLRAVAKYFLWARGIAPGEIERHLTPQVYRIAYSLIRTRKLPDMVWVGGPFAGWQLGPRTSPRFCSARSLNPLPFEAP